MLTGTGAASRPARNISTFDGDTPKLSSVARLTSSVGSPHSSTPRRYGRRARTTIDARAAEVRAAVPQACAARGAQASAAAMSSRMRAASCRRPARAGRSRGRRRGCARGVVGQAGPVARRIAAVAGGLLRREVEGGVAGEPTGRVPAHGRSGRRLPRCPAAGSPQAAGRAGPSDAVGEQRHGVPAVSPRQVAAGARGRAGGRPGPGRRVRRDEGGEVEGAYVDQRQMADVPALGAQPPGHLERHHGPEAEAPEEVGPLRVGGCKGLDVPRRELGDRAQLAARRGEPRDRPTGAEPPHERRVDVGRPVP